MTDEKEAKIATVAFIVQDDPRIIQKWADSRPLSLRVVQTVRGDDGLRILTASEMVSLVAGLYSDLSNSTRRKLRVFYRQQQKNKRDHTEAKP